MALSEEDIASSLSEPDQATKGFTFQQTMLRVKDPKVSLDFYTRVMGMRSVHWFYTLDTFNVLTTPMRGFEFCPFRKMNFNPSPPRKEDQSGLTAEYPATPKHI